MPASQSGTQSVTESQAGSVTYVLTCTIGARTASGQITVVWSLAPPALTFTDNSPPYAIYAGALNTLAWSSNQSSCLATGGAAGDGWSGSLPGSGQSNVTEAQPGAYSYLITCGAGSQAISQSILMVTYHPPTASLSLLDAPPPSLRVGQSIALLWTAYGACTASGGGAGDGWSGPIQPTGILYLTETTGGTYTYTITCGSTAIAQVTYTFSSAPPTAVLTPLYSRRSSST